MIFYIIASSYPPHRGQDAWAMGRHCSFGGVLGLQIAGRT